MTWNVFMERHDRWSGATLRSRIYALKDIGTNDEVIAMVSEMPEERYKAQLVRKAIKLGNIFTDGDIEKLKEIGEHTKETKDLLEKLLAGLEGE